MYKTSVLLDQVTREKLFVVILFLGDNLDKGLNYLVDVGASERILLIHHEPSFITVSYNLTQVKMFTLNLTFKVTKLSFR